MMKGAIIEGPRIQALRRTRAPQQLRSFAYFAWASVRQDSKQERSRRCFVRVLVRPGAYSVQLSNDCKLGSFDGETG